MVTLKQKATEKAYKLGFIKTGFSKTEPSQYTAFFKEWLAKGFHAGMKWMEKYADVRENPSLIFNGARTVISCAYPYSPVPFLISEEHKIARYAEPDKEDYHARIKKKLNDIAALIKNEYPDSEVRTFVDIPPLFEREAASRAGIGFIGKNCSLIIPGYGSYFFIGEIVTDIEFATGKAAIEPQCGECTKCIDACPTQALCAPYTLNANRCLSYLSIEHEGEIHECLGDKMEYLVGCDICQEVCPFNKEENDVRVTPLPSLDEFLDMDEKVFSERFGHTALSRPGLKRIQRNANLLKKNR